METGLALSAVLEEKYGVENFEHTRFRPRNKDYEVDEEQECFQKPCSLT